MPSTVSNASPSSAIVERVTSVAFEQAVADDSFGTPTEAHAELAQAAKRSVSSAIAVAEHFASGDKRSVTLQFSVSGVDLGVRVELRLTGVHTTFRTDSPELRAALAQEWQSVASTQFPDRASRLADPVFTSSSANTAGQGDTGARQHETPDREARRASEEFANLRGALRGRDAANAAVAAVPPVALRPAPFSSGRLHTFA